VSYVKERRASQLPTHKKKNSPSDTPRCAATLCHDASQKNKSRHYACFYSFFLPGLNGDDPDQLRFVSIALRRKQRVSHARYISASPGQQNQ
jgi:hypothetical protein